MSGMIKPNGNQGSRLIADTRADAKPEAARKAMTLVGETMVVMQNIMLRLVEIERRLTDLEKPK